MTTPTIVAKVDLGFVQQWTCAGWGALMEVTGFTDYYEIMELSPSSPPETIERKFRHLARRYHPDNQATGDRSRFDRLLEAHNTLKDSTRRAQYDAEHQHQFGPRPNWTEEASEQANDNGKAADSFGIERDVDVQNRILTMLYVKRRTNIREPGIGDAELERMSGCPPEHLEFHLWYLREKGWIMRSDDGLFTITIDGVDRATLIHQEQSAKKLITDQS